MDEKSTNFRDYLKHSTGPTTGTKHTKYPVGIGASPTHERPVSGIETNNPAKTKRLAKPPESSPLESELFVEAKKNARQKELVERNQ